MSEVYLGLGSNIGEKHRYLRRALALLEAKCRVSAVSSFYATEPVGYREQEWFVNCAARVETDLSPGELLNFIHEIESALGRQRGVPNGPRTIDIDILLFESLVIDEDGLTVPHPRMHERLFVLAPLVEIAADVVHPVRRKTISELWQRAPRTHGVRAIEPGNG